MQKLSWTTEKRIVNDLIPLEINPRTISDSQKLKLIESLSKFNLVDIPVINLDNTLIGGHQRCEILQLIGRGDEEIDVRVPNRLLIEKEIKEYNLISNTHSGEFDLDLLTAHFSDIDFEAIGIHIPDYDFANDMILAAEAKDDDYEIPAVIETDIVPGDYFEIGQHRLLCGDSTLVENWKRLCGNNLINTHHTDPPYNVNYVGGTKDALTILNDKQSPEEFYKFLLSFYSSAGEFTIAGASWYIWHADSEGHHFRQAFIDAGNKLAQTLIWQKDSMVLSRQDYHWQHEPCLYGWKLGAGHKWYSDRKQTTLLKFERPTRNADHPTMKPVPMVAYLLSNSSKQNDIVGDGFLGSGSTMVAAHQMQRICYGMELGPQYCQVIINRMRKLDPSLSITRNGKPY